MDFGIIRQLKIKKFWWLDTILYFVVVLLLSTFFCFLIFTFKISIEKKNISQVEKKIANTGTAQQKQLEMEVLKYQNKIDNFVTLLNAHKIPSKIFDAIKKFMLPNVWFNNFSMNAKSSTIQVAGETEDVRSLSQQIEIIENLDFVKEVSGLSISLDETKEINFNFNILVDQKIFFDIEDTSADQTNLPITPTLPDLPIIDTTSPSSAQPFVNSFSSL